MTDHYQEISRLVKPYAYACEVTRIINFSPASYESLKVECWLKPDDDGPGSNEPKYIRAALFGSAQSIIENLEGVGYTHESAPRVEIDGDIVVTYGKSPSLITSGNVELSLLWKAVRIERHD